MAKAWRPYTCRVGDVVYVHTVDFAQWNGDVSGWTVGHSERRGIELPMRKPILPPPEVEGGGQNIGRPMLCPPIQKLGNMSFCPSCDRRPWWLSISCLSMCTLSIYALTGTRFSRYLESSDVVEMSVKACSHLLSLLMWTGWGKISKSGNLLCPVAPTPWNTGGTCPPTFTNGWARGVIVSRRTANEKLFWLYESAHQDE